MGWLVSVHSVAAERKKFIDYEEFIGAKKHLIELDLPL
jgi:hypothetical protein